MGGFGNEQKGNAGYGCVKVLLFLEGFVSAVWYHCLWFDGSTPVCPYLL